MSETIVIGSDHAGFAVKEHISEYLSSLGYKCEDKGCSSAESVHYPIYGKAVAQAVSSSRHARGILICGTGIGMSIVANRFPGVRAALCHDAFTAAASREHNNSNILVIGARTLEWPAIKEIIDLWLNTPFAGGRHAERVEMIDNEA